MTVQEPAWRKRTRPCPFFSQGRCLFADSCNFLHDVKVRNAAEQPHLHTIRTKQQLSSPSPTFGPPSVVINSTSPRSVMLAGPDNRATFTQDSSRYSGLLSVLSDVIGPPLSVAEDTDPEFRTVSTVPSSPQSTVGPDVPPRPDTEVAGSQPTGAVVDMETEQGASGSTEPSSILQVEEDTLLDPFGYQMESFFPEAYNSSVAENHSIPDPEQPSDGITETRSVDTKPESEEEEGGGGGEEIDNCEEENPAVIMSNRQSTFSSFTGASLLASPRNSVASPIAGGAVDLLSPVELSAKLYPFPIPLSGSKITRGDSIDSGYAEGDSWVSPLPFPRTPPRSLRSSAIFPSHSRRTSYSSTIRDGGLSCGTGSRHPFSRNPIGPIEEIESDGSFAGDEDTTYTILDAYERSGEQGGHEACRVNVVAADKAKGDVGSSEDIPAVTHSPRMSCPEHLRPTEEHDLNSCSRSSFVSDDNLSFKTALSTQPSYEDFSDISKLSSANLSSVSGCPAHNTSVSILSHYADASKVLEPSIVSSSTHSSLHCVPTACLAGQVDNNRVSEALALEGVSLPEESFMDSDVLFTPLDLRDFQGLIPEKFTTPRGSLSGASHSDRSPSVDASHGWSSDKDAPGHVALSADDLGDLVQRKAVPLRKRLSGVFDLDNHSPKSSPSTKIANSSPLDRNVRNSTPSGVNEAREFATESAAVLQKCFPSILPHGGCPPKPSLSSESSHSPSPRKEVFSHAVAGINDVQEFIPYDIAPQKCLSGVLLSDPCSPPSSFAGGSSSPSSNSIPHHVPHGVNRKQECSPGTFHFKRNQGLSPSADNSHNPSPIDVQELALAPPECLSGVLYSDKPSPEPNPSDSDSSSTVPHSVPLDVRGDDCGSAEPAIQYMEGIMGMVSENPADDTLRFDETTESFDSECSSFTERLMFPLPPPFLPAESIESPSLDGEETMPVVSETAVAKSVLEARTISQGVDVQRLRSGSDLTEKARPTQLPSVLTFDFPSDFILRRSRAASDITVKGKLSPVASPDGNSCRLEPPLVSPDQTGQSDQIQLPYDPYISGGTSDRGSDSPSSPYDTVPIDAASSLEESLQDVHPQSPDVSPQVFPRLSPPLSDGQSSYSGMDSPSSEPIFRPFLTGRRSLLHTSLAELVPQTNLARAMKSASLTQQSTRLQTRQIGSSMVPLGFRRHKPQPAAMQSLQSTSQPLPTASALRQALRIRTDIVKEYTFRGCSSANQVSSPTQSPLIVKSLSAPPTGGLRQLRLSSILNRRSSVLSTNSSSITSSILSLDHIFNLSTPQSPSVSSASSFSCNSLLSSSRKPIPEQAHHTLKRTSSNSLVLQTANAASIMSQFSPDRRDSRSVSAPTQQPKSWRLSHYRAGSRNHSSIDVACPLSRRISTLSLSYVVGEERDIDDDDSLTRPTQSKPAEEWTHPSGVLAPPVHAIATPKPTLLFAIASDDVNQVHQVLESGEAGPNDSVGPQSALAFTLTNDKLTHKQEIVKALLAYGANPSALRNPTLNPAQHKGGDESNTLPPETTLDGMDPATRYFVSRADATQTRQSSQFIYRSFFRPLARVRYDVIGQDWALEQLFRILGLHSQKLAVAPIVVLLCGPSGHGKSLLARKFGLLLGIPTHTVNMTTLQSAHDIWQSYSMSPYEEPSSSTLAEFLIENEGKRCVVVLDEIEKVEDQRVLWSLLMPWELGRCSWEAGKRHVDVRNAIWLGTSNIGHELVFEHHENRAEPDHRMSRENYLELTDMMRPRVSQCLGASLVSRVTAILPFVPFTLDEKRAIAAETIYAFGNDACKTQSPQDVESLVMKVLPDYRPNEGARSLHRAVSNILADVI